MELKRKKSDDFTFLIYAYLRNNSKAAKTQKNRFPYLGNQKWNDTEPLTVFVSPTVTAQELSVKN